jgi:hypothetical protein
MPRSVAIAWLLMLLMSQGVARGRAARYLPLQEVSRCTCWGACSCGTLTAHDLTMPGTLPLLAWML